MVSLIGLKYQEEKMPPKTKAKPSTSSASKKSQGVNHRANPLFCQLEGTCEISNFVYKGKLPMVIDYELFTETQLPADWHGKAAATRAAKGQETIAMYAGYFDCIVKLTSAEMEDLIQADELPVEGDEEGEFTIPFGQVRLSKLANLHKRFFPNVTQHTIINSMYILQNPTSSPWGKCFIRVISGHRYDHKTNQANIRFVVYYNRLLFEMISDSEVKRLTDHLTRDKLHIIPVRTKPAYVPMFVSEEGSKHIEYRFSLAGLMKHAENKGYPLAQTQPAMLNVPLYDFQKSTYQWMLDQELDEAGINYYFWEEWQYPGGHSLYYFPLAGEFRINRPPKTNGGLLCEGKSDICVVLIGN